MKDFKGPCFTLAETAERLELSLTELKYHIEQKQIQPVVFIKSRDMLLLHRLAPGEWIGYGTCHYRGHMELHLSQMLPLLDDTPIRIGKGFGRLLEDNGISSMITKYPFSRPIPHPPLVEWKILPPEELRQNCLKLLATPQPKEVIPIQKGIADFTLSLAKISKPEFVPNMAAIEESSKLPPALNFENNSLIQPDDLRIPASEIDRFQNPPEEQPKSINEGYSGGQRESQLHQLIHRILDQHPAHSAKEIWKVIQQDSEEDNPTFDTENILICVDESCIEWVSREGVEQHLKWASFAPLLSKLKKKRKHPVES